MSLNLRISLMIIGTAMLALIGLSLAAFEVREDFQHKHWKKEFIPELLSWSRSIILSPDPIEEMEWIADNNEISIRVFFRNGLELEIGDDLPNYDELNHLRPVKRRFTIGLPRELTVYHYEDRLLLLHRTPVAALIYSLDESNQPLSWLDHVQFFATIFASLAVLFGVVIFFTRYTLRPLKEMSIEMESVATQSSTTTAPVLPNTRDEIKRVAASFASMRLRVEELLASKERLLRDVSHEIRSPLARIRLRLEFIQDEQSRDQIAQDLSLIDSLASELLDRAYLDSGQEIANFTELDLGEQIRAAAAAFPSASAHFVLDIPAAAVLVHGNSRLLQRCLHNLLTNSLKYSTLAVNSIQLRLAITETTATAIVADQGAQLPAEIIKHLFEPFYRPDESRTSATGGHGLGLALVKSIVQAHGGTITSHSPASGGLEISLKLPRA